MDKGQTEVLLNTMEELAKITDMDDPNYDQQRNSLEDILPSGNIALTQDQFIHFMDLALNDSWDIPSALGTICHHTVFDPKDFPNFDIFPMHREPQSYWDDLNPWPLIDLHFKDIHGLDLADPRINWHFDT